MGRRALAKLGMSDNVLSKLGAIAYRNELKQLMQEGYDTFQVRGPMLKKQLSALIEKAEATRRSFPLS